MTLLINILNINFHKNPVARRGFYFVKGTNVSPEKRADRTKWLIEAEIILGYDNKPVDTLLIKQYFIKPNLVKD